MLEIEIVYGLSDKQVLKNMQVEEGTRIRAAALKSGLDEIFTDLDPWVFSARQSKTIRRYTTETVSKYTVRCRQTLKKRVAGASLTKKANHAV